MKKDLYLVCSECDMPIDIVNVREVSEQSVEILFVCTYCGRGKTAEHYLYRKNK